MAAEIIRFLQDENKLLFKASTLILIIFQLVSCSFPGFPDLTNELQIDPNNEWATEPVKLQFTLQIPHILSEGESIALEIIDDITGISQSCQTFELKEINEYEYTTNLSVPSGSVLKYRYIKTGKVIAPEKPTILVLESYRAMSRIKNRIHQSLTSLSAQVAN